MDTRPAGGSGAAPRIELIGADVPRQLILAAGATPVRLTGAWNGAVSPEAGELLGAADAVAARVLDGVLSGAQDGLAGLVVCNDSMAHLRIFYVLRVLAGRGCFDFPVHLLDTPRGGGEHRDRFVARQYEHLTDFVTGCTGTVVDATTLAEAAARETLLGRALHRMQGRRQALTLSGTDALRCYAAALQRTPEEAVGEIESLLDAPSTAPEDRVPVFVTGSSHPDTTAYEEIEQAGFLVVGEDHDTGDGAWVGEAVERASRAETFAALAELHARRSPAAARSLSSERTHHLLAAVEESGAAGAVALVRDLDDGPVWDLPGQREALVSSGRWLAAVVQVPADGILEATTALITQLHTREATS